MNSLTQLLLAASLVSTGALAKPLKLEVYTAGPAGFDVSSTLIEGDKDAILVDGQFTLADAHRLTAMIIESGKDLKEIFVTHAHPDHFFGLEVVLKQFPKAKVVARPEVIAEIKKIAPGKLAYWKKIYGANLTNKYVVPQPLTADSLTLEGEKLPLIVFGPGESEAAAAVYVPSEKTLISGDLAFDGVHMWLAEGRPEQWLANLEAVKKGREITRVIAGHRDQAHAEQGDVLAKDEAYIRDFLKVKAASKTPEEALKAMTALYPDYQLPIIADIAFKATMGK